MTDGCYSIFVAKRPHLPIILERTLIVNQESVAHYPTNITTLVTTP